MIHSNCIKTVIGGLSLLLVLSACSSGSKTRATASSPPSDMPRSDVVTDRGTTPRTTVPMDRTRLSDSSPEIAAACSSRMDAKGNVVFDDPSCPERYRRQAGTTFERDRAGLAAACPSRVDGQGNVVFDDPTCPDRYRSQAGMSDKDRTGLAAACPSRVDASGKVIYDDPACPDRYRSQTSRMDDRAGVVADCPSRVGPDGKIVYNDPACPVRNRYLQQENAYYDRYADKAVKHARAAEIAANQGNVPDMLQNAEISLDHAKEARRAGNNADLAVGIASLRQTIKLGQGNELPGATSSIREARVSLSRAAGIKTWDAPPAAGQATPVATHTVRGELARNERPATGVSGGEQYVLRDTQNREVPIALSPEMSQQVQVGDKVEAQVDSAGHVTSITKAP